MHGRTWHYCASSAFSTKEADLLVELGCPFIKLASMDINYLPLLEYVGQLGVPIVVSTGMASMGEIERALHTLRMHGDPEVVVLH